jgi:predicted RNA binding protein YcfA (HicA-like mRNA interferase family)
MSKIEKLILKLLAGNADQNFDFNDLLRILEYTGFHARIKGSHHIFTKENVEEIINLQPKGSKAKPYQVKQVRELLLKYKFIPNVGL